MGSRLVSDPGVSRKYYFWGRACVLSPAGMEQEGKGGGPRASPAGAGGARQRTIPGILARAGQYMEPRHGQFHKHRQGQCIQRASCQLGKPNVHLANSAFFGLRHVAAPCLHTHRAGGPFCPSPSPPTLSGSPIGLRFDSQDPVTMWATSLCRPGQQK
jgi:hypothetical protein